MCVFSPFLLIYGYNVCDGSGTGVKARVNAKKAKLRTTGVMAREREGTNEKKGNKR